MRLTYDGNIDWGFGKRREITFPMFGDGIFTQEGPAWKHSRELLRPQFLHCQYDDMTVFGEAVEDLFNALPEKGVVDLQPWFYKLTLDTTTAFLFGESVRSLLEFDKEGTDKVGEENFAGAFNTAQGYIQSRFRLGEFYWLAGGKKFQDCCRLVNKFADQLIDRNVNRGGKEEGSGRYVFLDTVAENVPDRDALRGQTVNILAAGRDTTATLLSWLL
jgi:cytochrome P450